MSEHRIKLSSILGAGFTLFIAISSFAEEKPWYPGCPASIKNSHECALYKEEKALKKYSDVVSIEKSNLIFRLTNGKTKTLTDIENEQEGIIIYNLTDVLKDIGYALVHGQYYEGDTNYL